MTGYQEFLTRKFRSAPSAGLTHIPAMPPSMFGHQSMLTHWALRKGRAAVFADTGLGKSYIELAWSDALVRATGHDVILLAPLAVAAQTARIGADIGIDVNVCRDDGDVRPGINITNYDRLHRFDTGRFGAVGLDESSCIKHHNAKTFSALLEAFSNTPFRLCATATPAPNDWTELGTHAEFLNVCSRPEMLAEFFVHDGGDTQTWRLKGHARQDFWRWVATWGAMVRKPSDLGYDDARYALPPLVHHEHTVDSGQLESDGLFVTEARTMSDRRDARKRSLAARVQMTAEIVNATRRPWIVWCDLNSESESLAKSIHGAVEIRGSHTPDEKESAFLDFADGRIRVLVTKPSIAGWGLNWQHCRDMAFVGVTDSFESYYQAVRRCWRFGQTQSVNVHTFASEEEGSVVSNLKRKERDAQEMAEALAAETREAMRQEIFGSTRKTNTYHANTRLAVPAWLTTETA
ncbi:helicase-related protein [Burkholderia ubonensis]|uniref:helicase-related protein n=1 Tax=Burkholderia ubonensis TaxID=101571 RepID=UPI0007557074|nr:helicase-related protein [Burkholderia ubonensis]KVO11801.1 helicase [Burkholderia ubonensis]